MVYNLPTYPGGTGVTYPGGTGVTYPGGMVGIYRVVWWAYTGWYGRVAYTGWYGRVAYTRG